jgi:hypothetical protein
VCVFINFILGQLKIEIGALVVFKADKGIYIYTHTYICIYFLVAVVTLQSHIA